MSKWFVLLSLLVMAACAAPPNNQSVYAAHVARFSAAQPHTEHWIRRADGHQIHAREFNPSRKGAGPTLVMMHGFPDNQHLYDLLIPTLSPHFHIVTFDFLGWGASEKPIGHRYDVASQRRDLEAVVERLSLGKVVLVLHDLSGQSGIDWALDHQGETEALVLLNTYYSPMEPLVAPEAIDFYATPGVLRDLAVWGATKSGARFQSGVGGQLARFFSDPAVRDAFTPILTNASASIRPAFFSSTSVLWSELEARRAKVPLLLQFPRPVHVIFGADDPYLNSGVGRELAALFPESTLTLLHNAGHYVQLDQAEVLGRQLHFRLLPR